jgi:hypothetical protein
MRVTSLLLVTALCTGCNGGAFDTSEIAPPTVPGRDGTRWTQYCTYHGATDLTEINAWIQQLGRQGWELVGVGGNTATMYCFKARASG